MTDPFGENGKSENWVPIEPGLFRYPSTQGEAPGLLANQCKKCRKSFFPKRKLCPVCFETDMKEIQLNRQGEIYSAAVVRIPSPAGIKAPYAYGYVDIPKNNIRLFALFSGDNPADFVPGREVELVLAPVYTDSQGQKVIGYKFKLVS